MNQLPEHLGGLIHAGDYSFRNVICLNGNHVHGAKHRQSVGWIVERLNMTSKQSIGLYRTWPMVIQLTSIC